MTIQSSHRRPLPLLLTASLSLGSLAVGLQPPAIAAPSNQKIQVTTPTSTSGSISQIKIIQVATPSRPAATYTYLSSTTKSNFAWPTDGSMPPSSLKPNYIWPVNGVITSGFGPRWGRMHSGIDIAGPAGTPIHAAADGVVISAGWNDGGYGNLVKIQHPNGSVTFYAHNQKVLVRQGQQVHKGEIIAELGSTGNSTGPHCHFEIRPQGEAAVNPLTLLDKTVANQPSL